MVFLSKDTRTNDRVDGTGVLALAPRPLRLRLLTMDALSWLSPSRVNEQLFLILGRLSLVDLGGIQSSVSTWPSPCGGDARVRSPGQSGWVHIGSQEDEIKGKYSKAEPGFVWNCFGARSWLQALGLLHNRV